MDCAVKGHLTSADTLSSRTGSVDNVLSGTTLQECENLLENQNLLNFSRPMDVFSSGRPQRDSAGRIHWAGLKPVHLIWPSVWGDDVTSCRSPGLWSSCSLAEVLKPPERRCAQEEVWKQTNQCWCVLADESWKERFWELLCANVTPWFE